MKVIKVLLIELPLILYLEVYLLLLMLLQTHLK